MTYDREKARVYAERWRDKKWAAAAMDATRCPRMLSRGLKCNAPLGSRLVNGETVPFCAQCDAKRRGICIDCRTAPVDGTPRKAVRCAACKKLALLDSLRRYAKRHPAKIKAQWKRRVKRLRKNPAEYQAALDRKKLWRLANPKAKARYAKKSNVSDHAREYQRARRVRIAQEKRDMERERARLRKAGIIMTHPCFDCGAPITGRPKKCAACAESVRKRAYAILTGAAA